MDVARLEKEQAFHDERFGGDDSARKDTAKYYAVYKHAGKRFAEIISCHCPEKKLLEYGCGMGLSLIHI